VEQIIRAQTNSVRKIITVFVAIVFICAVNVIINALVNVNETSILIINNYCFSNNSEVKNFYCVSFFYCIWLYSSFYFCVYNVDSNCYSFLAFITSCCVDWIDYIDCVGYVGYVDSAYCIDYVDCVVFVAFVNCIDCVISVISVNCVIVVIFSFLEFFVQNFISIVI